MGVTLHRIRAVNFRCLRNVDVALDEFNVLVGANGSGKSALFDALLFVGDMVRTGLTSAVERRTSDFRDLVWARPDHNLTFQLAFEIGIPDAVREQIPQSYRRFAISLSVHEVECGDLRGTLRGRLKPGSERSEELPRGSTFVPGIWRTEMAFDSGISLRPTIEFEHPLVTRLVTDTFFRISHLALENRLLRQASKLPRLGRPTLNGGLPWLIHRLRHYPDRYGAWLRHVRTAIADVHDIDVKVRPDDRHSYLVATVGGGVEVPSWALSDGTLRLLALSIIAYLPEEGRTYLIEEPENGVHPLAVEAIYRSLSSTHGAQVLVTTHSPVLLACTEPKELLCFSKRDGETQIIRGDEHPHLARHWQSAADVDLLFAPEVLG